MKTKKLILGSLVLVFSVGFAMASTLFVQPRIKAYVDQQAFLQGNDTCEPVNTNCTNSDPNDPLCFVEVFTTRTGVDKTAPALDAVCNNQLTHTTSDPIPTEDSFYEIP